MYNSKQDLAIASRPSGGCPIGTFGCGEKKCPNTCFCEDHCSWKKCRLENPPQSCLYNTKLKWDFDGYRNHWKSVIRGISVKKTVGYIVYKE